MPANDEFPRGAWLFSGRISAGPTAAVTFPATPGISWVLKEIDATLFAISAAVFASEANITVNVALYGVLFVEIPTASASNQIAKDTFSWSGSYQFAQGEAVIVSFDSGTNTIQGEVLNAYAEPV